MWGVVEPDGWRSPVAKFLSGGGDRGADIRPPAPRRATPSLVVADDAAIAARVLGDLRLDVGVPAEGNDLLWVVDFPMFEWNEDEKRWDALHHPFTAPSGDLDADPGTWRSRAYDMVWNGSEIGGGSIRIADPAVQPKVFAALGMSEEQARERFGFLLEALTYGAPRTGAWPSGSTGSWRCWAGRDSIRDVIAFPKTASGTDPAHRRPGAGGRAPAARARLRPALSLVALAQARACTPAVSLVEPTPLEWESGSGRCPAFCRQGRPGGHPSLPTQAQLLRRQRQVGA